MGKDAKMQRCPPSQFSCDLPILIDHHAIPHFFCLMLFLLSIFHVVPKCLALGGFVSSTRRACFRTWTGQGSTTPPPPELVLVLPANVPAGQQAGWPKCKRIAIMGQALVLSCLVAF